MSDIKQRLYEDRAMRDVAKQLISRDIDNLRGDVEQKGIVARFGDRMKEGAEGAVDESRSFIEENPSRVASVAGLGLGMLLIWLFRDTIAELFEKLMASLADLAPDIDRD